MPFEAKKEHYKVLEQVTTVAEAARIASVDRKTILYAIWVENIAASKVGGVWLVSLSSFAVWNKNRLRKAE